MTAPMSCDQAQELMGVLILGAISPAERETVQSHVRGCPDCVAVFAELSVLPGLLKRIDADAMATSQASTDLLDRIVEEVRSESAGSSRATSWRVLAAAAAVVVVVVAGVAAAVLWSGRTAETATASDVPTTLVSVPVSAKDPATGITATVTLEPTNAGAEVHLAITGVPTGEQCEIVVVSTDGKRDVAASWMAGYTGTAEVTASTPLEADTIARIEIATPDGRDLVTVPMAT